MKKLFFLVAVLFLMTGVSHSIDLDSFVQETKRVGLVQKVTFNDIAATMYVRPSFHEMDYDHKRTIARAFFEWSRKQSGKDYNFIMIRDSRNNNSVGNYDHRLGLSLKRSYR